MKTTLNVIAYACAFLAGYGIVLVIITLFSCGAQVPECNGALCQEDYWEARVPGRPAPKGDKGDTVVGPRGPTGQGCVSQRIGDGVVIQCGEYTHVIYDGQDGIAVDGKDGESIVGPAGKDGTSCEVEQASNGVIVECGDTSALILNGSDGADGNDAPPTALTFVDVIDPCGPERSDGLDEVLFLTADGRYVAYADHSNGKQGRLSILPAGSYITTDGTGCAFTITNEGDIEHD